MKILNFLSRTKLNYRYINNEWRALIKINFLFKTTQQTITNLSLMVFQIQKYQNKINKNKDSLTMDFSQRTKINRVLKIEKAIQINLIF